MPAKYSLSTILDCLEAAEARLAACTPEEHEAIRMRVYHCRGLWKRAVDEAIGRAPPKPAKEPKPPKPEPLSAELTQQMIDGMRGVLGLGPLYGQDSRSRGGAEIDGRSIGLGSAPKLGD